MKTSHSLAIFMAQINPYVGDLLGNGKKIIAAAKEGIQQGADVVVFPELALTGYPPEDLLFRPDFRAGIAEALKKIAEETKTIDLILGCPHEEGKHLYNAALYLRQGEIFAYYHKRDLPNYGIFDEKRYFTPGDKHLLIEKNGFQIALAICEDLWFPSTALEAKKAGAHVIFSLNASPFDMRKLHQRQEILKERIAEVHLPIVYVNGVGGQDEFVFDGGSFVMDGKGEVVAQAPFFKEANLLVSFSKDTSSQTIHMTPQEKAPVPSLEEATYEALVLALRDYVKKNHFPGVLLGLSGGIDSALTLAIAVDALGPQGVEAILLPSRHTSPMSLEDAMTLSNTLKVPYEIISIEPCYDAFLNTLAEPFKSYSVDKTEENLQARCRGTILMALSNKKGSLLLTTGNKSEMAVGYATLYGDMAGGFAVIKDVPKTLVYRLAHFRNEKSPVIPKRIIERAPTAELAPDQTDQDTLPPYEDLDAILQYYVEEDQSVKHIAEKGYDVSVIQQVIRMVDATEYKRRQAPIGPRVTHRAFGRERRYPITSGYRSFS